MTEENETDRPEGQGFLASWSRRKRAAAKLEANRADDIIPETGEAGEAIADPLPEPGTQPEPELSAEQLAALPSVDDITGTTDLAPFLQRGVPKALRKVAMRKVWLSNKLICDHDDPAVDYAWDWNAPEGVPGAGGTLSKESVSKMFDDLFKPSRPLFVEEDMKDARIEGDGEAERIEEDRGQAAPPEVDDEPANTKPEQGLPTDPVRQANDTVARAGEGSPETPMERTAPQTGRTGHTLAPAPRRHGGAMPE